MIVVAGYCPIHQGFPAKPYATSPPNVRKQLYPRKVCQIIDSCECDPTDLCQTLFQTAH